MLLDDYTLRIMLPDCNPSSDKVNAIADLTDDLTGFLPYLNRVFKGDQYIEKSGILIVKRGGHLITFRPKEIAITKLEDEKDAGAVMEDLKRVINETYQNREQIEPDYSTPRELKAWDVQKLLPGTNCRKCGAPTCFAFVFKLIRHETHITRCTPLFSGEFEKNRKSLLALLRESGYEV